MTVKTGSNHFYLPELDGLRFLAFFLVFCSHHVLFWKIPFFSFLQTHGWIGVDLFFVISAFLFTKILSSEIQQTGTIHVGKFFIRRVLRIWPLYFIFVFISFLFHLYFKGNISNYFALRLFGLLSFSDNIFTAIYGINKLPFVFQLWSISYEEQFYICIPFITLFLAQSTHRKRMLVLLLVFVFFTTIRMALILQNIGFTALWVLPISHFDSILFGIILGFGGFDFLLNKIKPLLGLLVILLFLGLILFSPKFSDKVTASYAAVLFISSLISLLFVHLVMTTQGLKKIFSSNLLVFLGKRSYGFYIFHTLGNGVARFLINKLCFIPSNDFASFVYSFFFTLVVSIISYPIIETPFLQLKKRFEVAS